MLQANIEQTIEFQQGTLLVKLSFLQQKSMQASFTSFNHSQDSDLGLVIQDCLKTYRHLVANPPAECSSCKLIHCLINHLQSLVGRVNMTEAKDIDTIGQHYCLGDGVSKRLCMLVMLRQWKNIEKWCVINTLERILKVVQGEISKPTRQTVQTQICEPQGLLASSNLSYTSDDHQQIKMEDKTSSPKQYKMIVNDPDRLAQVGSIERVIHLLRKEKEEATPGSHVRHHPQYLWSLYDVDLDIDKEMFCEMVSLQGKLSQNDRKNKMYAQCLRRNFNIRGIIKNFGYRVQAKRSKDNYKQNFNRTETKSSTCYSENDIIHNKTATSLQKTKVRIVVKPEDKNKPKPCTVLKPQIYDIKDGRESRESKGSRDTHVRIRRSIPKVSLAQIEEKRTKIETKLDSLINEVKSVEVPSKRERKSVLKSTVFDSSMVFQVQMPRRIFPTQKGFYMRRFERIPRGTLREEVTEFSQQYMGKSKFNKSFLLQ